MARGEEKATNHNPYQSPDNPSEQRIQPGKGWLRDKIRLLGVAVLILVFGIGPFYVLAQWIVNR